MTDGQSRFENLDLSVATEPANSSNGGLARSADANPWIRGFIASDGMKIARFGTSYVKAAFGCGVLGGIERHPYWSVDTNP
ncbi:MAG: hypothetical protein ACRESI_07115 [Gammaproteobacteria bacterium]